MVGGEISPHATLYSGPIELSQNVILKSRNLRNGEWSALSEAAFQVNSDRSPGDANGDGFFDRNDIVSLLQSGKYETGEAATWSEGDFNEDGIFDKLDLVTALQIGDYLPDGAFLVTKRQDRDPT